MPEIKPKHIISFSSEDKNFPAENLLKGDGFKKWKSGVAGEKQVSAVIQLEKASKIDSIDIGNEGSAFVEVLVGRSSDLADKNYQVLLVASSFMTPIDSRNGTNISRVRMFGADSLSKSVAQEKWDVVKVVCTQPFNRNICYGISFIKLHGPPEPGESSTADGATSKKDVKTFGAFKMKSDDTSSEKDPIPVGGLFAQRNKPEPPPLTGAAAVRAASKLAEESMAKDTTTPSKPAKPEYKKTPSQESAKHEHRKTPSQESGPSKPSKMEKTPSRESGAKRDTATPKRKHDDDEDRPSMKKHPTSERKSPHTGASSSHGPPPQKKAKPEPKPSKPFKKLMEDVVFVLSGYQNPYRADLRDMAVEMGAKYKPDWGRECTHLICAFANTPKFNAVKGKGRIVTRHWIMDCHKQKKLLPWRKYKLGDYDSPSSSSSSEDDDDEDWATAKKPAAPTNKKTPEKKGKSPAKTKPTSKIQYDDSSTDVGSDGDTDDEIRRVHKQNAKSPAKPAATTSKGDNDDDDIFMASTDEDEPPESKKASPAKKTLLPDLPDFFKSKTFMLYGGLSDVERRTMQRFIIAYNGCLEEYMNDKVNFVITKSNWDEEFDKALNDQPSLSFVRPQWIYDCDKQQKLLPHQKYLIVPN